MSRSFVRKCMDITILSEGFADCARDASRSEGVSPAQPPVLADAAAAEAAGRESWCRTSREGAPSALTKGQQSWLNRLRKGDLSGVDVDPKEGFEFGLEFHGVDVTGNGFVCLVSSRVEFTIFGVLMCMGCH